MYPFVVLCSLFCVFLGPKKLESQESRPLHQIQCDIVPIDSLSKTAHPTVGHKLNYSSHHFIAQGVATQPPLTSSLNWAGYVSAVRLEEPKNHKVKMVAGSWLIPTTLNLSLTPAYSLTWVGMDGYVNHAIEHIGTAQDIHNGYGCFAWFEMKQGRMYKLNHFPVEPGDQISAFVKHVGGRQYEMNISNVTKGVSYTIPSRYTRSSHGQQSTAEWIVEAPYHPTHQNDQLSVLPLANFGSYSFFACSTEIEGRSGAIINTKWDTAALTMTGKATVGTLIFPGTAFTVTWAGP